MSNIPVARRYARALLDAASNANAADLVLEQLEALTGFFEANKELYAAMSSPALSKAQRMTLTDAVVKAVPGLHQTVINVLKLLTDRNRFGAVTFITRQYRDLVDVRLGRVRGQLTSATKLGDEQVANIRKSLETLTGRTVLLETTVDAKLLGGVVAQVGSKLYDGSLKSQLRDLGQALAAPVR
jgi:F-type H+-transporting ATPase subunit delta